MNIPYGNRSIAVLDADSAVIKGVGGSGGFGFGFRRPTRLLDLSRLPQHPAPWTIVSGDWKDANGAKVKCIGDNVTGYALLPTTQAEANLWARDIYNRGVRVVNIHQWDNAINDNVAAHTPRLHFFLSALKALGIPWMTEGSATRCDKQLLYNANAAERTKWVNQVDQFMTAVPAPSNLLPMYQEPYFLGICPVNEDVTIDGLAPWDGVTALVEATYNTNQTWYRSELVKMGYNGPTWPSNAGIPAGWNAANVVGECECWHRYTDHQIDGPPINYWDTYDGDQPWNQYTARTTKPLFCGEHGHLWPAETRALSERQFIDHATSLDCQIIFPFAIATRAEVWGAVGGAMESYTFYNDPIRLATQQYAAYKITGGVPANLRYAPVVGGTCNAQNTGFTSTVVSGPRKQVTNLGTAPIVTTISCLISVPAGKMPWSLTPAGSRVASLPVVADQATATTMWTELV